MSLIDEDYIRNILNNIATANNIDMWSYSRQKFETIAQNYFGVLIPVNVVATINGKEENVSLVLKLAPTEESYRVSGAVTVMFAREIFVYTTLLEKYKEQQQNIHVSHQLIIPKCYFTRNEYCREALVMQDMCREGYKPYVSDMFLDIHHITISLNALAKFHALSFVLRKRDLMMFEQATNICMPLTEKSNSRFMHILRDRLKKALCAFEGTKYVPLLQNLLQNCAKFIKLKSDSKNRNCICHGDIWKENILFQYEDNKPVSACLIDYQTARMCSPAFDVLYLISSSTDTDLRRDYFYKLLNVYYDSFDQTLREAGMVPQNVYSRQLLDEDLKAVGPACLIVANTALWLSCGLQEEGHVRSKQVWVTDEEKAGALAKYRSIIKGIIDDFCSYDYLCIL